eukprot:361894-Chlamydomonas_euryale.AAC.8
MFCAAGGRSWPGDIVVQPCCSIPATIPSFLWWPGLATPLQAAQMNVLCDELLICIGECKG